MADESTSSGSSETPHPERLDETRPVKVSNGSKPMAVQPLAPQETPQTRRPVYEPTLFQDRKRRRASPWVVIPSLVIVLGIAVYFMFAARTQHRFVSTAGKIVFASDQGSPGISHLWIADADGTNMHRLTTSAASDTAPNFSADGSEITYLSTLGTNEPQVFVIEADGKNPFQVTHGAGAKAQPAFAPSDSSLLGYTAGGALNTSDLTTHETDRLLPPAATAKKKDDPDALSSAQTTITVPSFAWAPVKDRAQQGLAAIKAISATLGDVQSLVLFPNLQSPMKETQDNGSALAVADAVSCGWSPDGGLLAVAMIGAKGLPAGRQASVLLLLNSQGNVVGDHPLLLSRDGTTGPENPVFSPDGSQVLFEVWHQPDLANRTCLGLFLVSVSGDSGPHRLYAGSAEGAHFSADGSHIYFLSPRKSGHDLYRIAIDGTGLQRLSDGQSDISNIVVSPQSAVGATAK